MKNAAKLAVCSISTAVSVVLMFFGGISFVLTYAMPMIVGLFMIMLCETFNKSTAVITYTATSLLSFILVSDKECFLMYVMFFGYYPIVRYSIEKLKNKPIKMILKLCIFNISLILCQLALIYVFNIPFLEEGEGKIFIIVFAVLMNFLFVLYERLLISLTILYKKKIEKRIKKLFK